MNLPKKFTYDGQLIIKIGKKELYPFVYKRIWDLTKYDEELLNNYGLKKAKYIYIGSSGLYNLKARCSHWKYEIKKNNKCISKEIRNFIYRLECFYKLETSYTKKMIEELLYYNAEIIARCESKKQAIELEKFYTSNYHGLDFMGEILEPQVILLSKVDSGFKEQENKGIKALKVK